MNTLPFPRMGSTTTPTPLHPPTGHDRGALPDCRCNIGGCSKCYKDVQKRDGATVLGRRTTLLEHKGHGARGMSTALMSERGIVEGKPYRGEWGGGLC